MLRSSKINWTLTTNALAEPSSPVVGEALRHKGNNVRDIGRSLWNERETS